MAKARPKSKPRRVPRVKRTPTPASAAAARNYQYVCELAVALPGVELGTSYGTPSIKVKGKILSRLRSESEGGLAIRCDFVDRQMLLQAAPETFYITDHYANYPMILVNLDTVRSDALPDIVERAWRLVAPPRLQADFDKGRDS
jgi:hypothetical protein